MKQFFGKKSRRVLALILMVSLGLHVIAIVIFGTIRFVTEAMREETVFEAANLDAPPQQEMEHQVMIEPQDQTNPPPRPEAIVVNNPSELNIPSLDIDLNIDTSAVYSRSGGAFGGGLQQVRDMAITANLFGTQVTATNLGVVLDISGSAHSHLDKAITEINKNFPQAHVIFVVGCGMSDGTGAIDGGRHIVPGRPRVVPYSRTGSNAQYDNLRRSVPGQLEGFFRRVGAERANELQREFRRRDNLYSLYGGDILAANFAFDYLLEQNVDTIYWFADFDDAIDAKIIEDLTKRLRQERVKVIAHNFTGRSVRREVKEMVDRVGFGSTTIEVVPG